MLEMLVRLLSMGMGRAAGGPSGTPNGDTPGGSGSPNGKAQ
jgi:hypothetical protein